MYDVARFVKSKREDWDNGCGPTERADLDAMLLAIKRDHLVLAGHGILPLLPSVI
jgi:hypothetical protein